MNSCYRQVFHAQIENENLHIIFFRLYEDISDPMCDSLNGDWVPVDDFRITIKKVEPQKSFKCGCGWVTEIISKPGNEFEVLTNDKKLANYIWYLGKHGTTFEQFKAMHEANKF